jgi:hypothetical protein
MPSTCAPRRGMSALARIALGRMPRARFPYLRYCLFHGLACWCVIIHRTDLFICLASRTWGWFYMLSLRTGFGLVTLSYLQTSLRHQTKNNTETWYVTTVSVRAWRKVASAYTWSAYSYFAICLEESIRTHDLEEQLQVFFICPSGRRACQQNILGMK